MLAIPHVRSHTGVGLSFMTAFMALTMVLCDHYEAWQKHAILGRFWAFYGSLHLGVRTNRSSR
jgi:hypothetical protein